MAAGGGKADEDIARFHAVAGQDLALFHDAGGVTGQVVFIFGIDAGHLSGLAADQGTAGLLAALDHALDDLGGALGHVLAHGHVVQEEQGLCAAADDVVDTHSHAVHTHGVVLVHDISQLQLGAHAVGAGDHDGLAVAGRQLKAAAEAAQRTDDAGNIGGFHHGFDQVCGSVAGGHVHAGGCIAVALGNAH